MSRDADRLYGLLPAIYRLRDAEQGDPLRALLAAFAREFAALEENIEQLYDDQFIETCADWVAPYIGDLIGYRPLHGVVPKVASPRAEVANTIAYRRRKGTATMLEQLARDVTDWPAHAAEFFQQLATTQYMNHPRPQALATANTRNLRAMLGRGGAFNAVAHTADVRRPEAGSGRYNVPNIGLFMWRLLALPLTQVPLTPDAGDTTGRKFRVNPLGADLRLFRHPQTEDDISHLSEPINVPEPLSVRLMALAVRAAQASAEAGTDARLDDDYGHGKSLALWRPTSTAPELVPVSDIRVCDLRDIVDTMGNAVWNHEDAVLPGTVGIDPERGRVLLGAVESVPLLASFHYGTARRIGGGEYERVPSSSGSSTPTSEVSRSSPLQAKLNAIKSGGQLYVTDSYTYAETPTFMVNSNCRVVVSAINSARPLIASTDQVLLKIGSNGTLIIEGMVFSGGALRLAAKSQPGTKPSELILRDCTLVPGIALNPDGSPALPGAVSLFIDHPFASVTLERCITGPIQAVAGAKLTLKDCIVDAGAPESVAFAGSPAGALGAELSMSDCTVIGKVHTSLARLLENSIIFARLAPPAFESWSAPVRVQRRQEGCVRFCYVPAGSITPRRYRCIPDTAHPAAVPHFTSLRYGDPGYAQLRSATDLAIREGASDGSEMGVLRPLNQPQREANLRLRLDEYLRFGLHAGVFRAT